MSGEVGDGQPLAGRVVEVMAASRGDTLVAWSEGRQGADLLLSAPLDQAQRPVSLGIGERLEVVWRDLGELHALPVVLAAIDSGERPRWRLGVVGVLRRGQRREAVRAPLSVAIHVGPELTVAEGTTVDVSEGGCRCILSRRRPPWSSLPSPDQTVGSAGPDSGAVVRVAVLFSGVHDHVSRRGHAPACPRGCPGGVVAALHRADRAAAGPHPAPGLRPAARAPHPRPALTRAPAGPPPRPRASPSSP